MGGECAVYEGEAGYGAYGMFDAEIDGLGSLDASRFALTATYDLSTLSPEVSLIARIEVSRIPLDEDVLDTDVTTFSFGLTIPIGEGSDRPIDAMRTARGDVRSATVSGLGSLF